MKEMTDFITSYVNLFSRITDAPKEMQEAAALFLISTAVGRKWVFRSMPETGIFRNRVGSTGKLLNLWFIILGKSRISRKSSGVVSHVEDVCKKVFGEERLLSEAFTPEALVKELSEKSVRSSTYTLETPCCWISDETAWLFQQLKKKHSYMTAADSFLCKLYDGDTYSRGTVGRGKETVWNPFVTIFMSSTPFLPTLFDELQIRLGFLNRFIFVVAERKERKPLRTEPLTEEEKKQAYEIKDFLKALAERTSVAMLEMTNEAKHVYDSFEEEIENRIETEDLGIREGYCGQLPNLVVRLSCLYSISRMMPDEIRSCNDPVLTVEKQDVEKAINYAWKAWAWFGKVIEIMQTKPSRKLRPRDKVQFAVVEFLKDGKERHFDEIQSHIHHMRLRCSQATLYNALGDLVSEEKVARTRFGFYKIRRGKDENETGKGR